jgi:hypothetical protein
MTQLKPRQADPAKTNAGTATLQTIALNFPTLDQIIQQGSPNIIVHAESEQKRYAALADTGAGADRVRARIAAVAYSHATALLREAEKARAEMKEQSQHPRAKSR